MTHILIFNYVLGLFHETNPEKVVLVSKGEDSPLGLERARNENEISAARRSSGE